MHIKERLIEFDFMRSAAIALVLLQHLPDYGISSLVPIREFFHFAHLGLGLFIFISGYLLYNNNSHIRLSNIFTFYKKRLIRIYPLYLTALVSFFLVFEIVSIYFGFDFVSAFNRSLTSYLIHFFSAQVLLAPGYVNPLLTLWYIGLIVLYYLLYPVLVIRCRNINDIFIRSVIIFLIFAGLHVSFNIIEERFFYYYFIFITGIICSDKKVFSHVNFNKAIPAVLLLYISTFLVYDYFYELNIFTKLFILYITIMSFTFLMFYTGRSVLSVSSGRLQNIFLLISTSSYCVYLFHRPIISLFYGAGQLLSPMMSDFVILFVSIQATFIIGYYIQIAEYRIHSKVSDIGTNYKNRWISAKGKSG
jgi:peptidoglycan/LPS O-acetylase OafA/YrhL